MRKLWQCKDWSEYISEDRRTGIFLRFDDGVDKEVMRAGMQFVGWLKEQYQFPVKVWVHFQNTQAIICRDGSTAAASFFGPFHLSEEPYIRIAVGDYEQQLAERGKDNALADILHSIAHELTHYYQWIKLHDRWIESEKDKDTERKLERQAMYYAREILCDYARIVDHP